MEVYHLTLRKLVEEVGISRGSVHSILTEDLCMWRVWAKFIPKLLTEQQKELHMEIAQDMLNCANNDLEFTKTIITGDETWVYGYDPENKFQSSQWQHTESPRPKKGQVCSNVKVMLTCFFDSHGIVHHEYSTECQTINKEYYLKFLHRLCNGVQRKWPDMWTENNFTMTLLLLIPPMQSQVFWPKTKWHLCDTSLLS